MKKLHALRGSLVLLLQITILTASANAQAPPLDSIKSQQELDKAVALLDAALFDAYNRCDLEKFSSFFVDDVEFYNDQGGVTRQAEPDGHRQEKYLRQGDPRTRPGYIAGLLHGGLWRRRGGRSPLSPPRA